MAGKAEGLNKVDWSLTMLKSLIHSGGLLTLEHRFLLRLKVLFSSISFSKSPKSKLSKSLIVYKFCWAISYWESPTTDRSLKTQFVCLGIDTSTVI